jgi:hypothetical protein
MRRVLLTLAIIVGAIVLVGAGLLHWFLRGDGVRVALEEQATAWLGHPVHIGDADVRVLPRPALELGTVVIGEPAAVTLARVRISTGLRALLSRRIEDAEIVIADSVIDLPIPFAIAGAPAGTRPGPTADGPAAVRAVSGADEPDDGGAAPLTIVSVRTIRLDAVRVRSRGREIVVSADAALTADTLTLQRFNASSGATSLDATGTVVLEPRVDADLTVEADRLGFDELMALAAAFSPAPAPRAGTSRTPGAATSRVRARVRAGLVAVSGAELANFAAELTSADGQLTVTPLTFTLFGGGFSGDVRADLRDAAALELSLNAELRNLDVAALAAFGGAAGAITGRLSSDGAFTGRGADASAALAAMRGHGTVAMVDGTLTKLELVRTVVLFFGRPAADAPASAGSRFDRIDATFALANRVVQASAFSLRSQDADVIGQGSLSLSTKALEGRARLVLSESLSAQAGTDLARFTREGNRIVLPATIDGTLNQPRISIDAAETIQRGLRNELQRRLGDFLRGRAP